MKKLSLFIIIAAVAILSLTYAVVSANKKVDEGKSENGSAVVAPAVVKEAKPQSAPVKAAEVQPTAEANRTEPSEPIASEIAKPATAAAVVQEVKSETSVIAKALEANVEVKSPAADNQASSSNASKAAVQPKATNAPAAIAPVAKEEVKVAAAPVVKEVVKQEPAVVAKEATQPVAPATAPEETKKSITVAKKQEVKVVVPAVTTPSSSSSSSSDTSSSSEEFCEEGC
ncbi:hypothetical protein [Paenibacillus sinopodophylli]|uniref:hypothetical protein n=1 Tax=Paenibacillus sinopodophylli TaxID=1837342 RepID=UPI00110CE95C|nr:hypothetical protein [Paenibacillus sinopodophylli]